jgi:hypothetical protein
MNSSKNSVTLVTKNFLKFKIVNLGHKLIIFILEELFENKITDLVRLNHSLRLAIMFDNNL